MVRAAPGGVLGARSYQDVARARAGLVTPLTTLSQGDSPGKRYRTLARVEEWPAVATGDAAPEGPAVAAPPPLPLPRVSQAAAHAARGHAAGCGRADVHARARDAMAALVVMWTGGADADRLLGLLEGVSGALGRSPSRPPRAVAAFALAAASTALQWFGAARDADRWVLAACLAAALPLAPAAAPGAAGAVRGAKRGGGGALLVFAFANAARASRAAAAALGAAGALSAAAAGAAAAPPSDPATRALVEFAGAIAARRCTGARAARAVIAVAAASPDPLVAATARSVARGRTARPAGVGAGAM